MEDAHRPLQPTCPVRARPRTVVCRLWAPEGEGTAHQGALRISGHVTLMGLGLVGLDLWWAASHASNLKWGRALQEPIGSSLSCTV